jgi:ribosomal protein S12 methylthiotransferase accessory factor
MRLSLDAGRQRRAAAANPAAREEKLTTLAGLANTPVPKRFFNGTHRVATPADTLARIRPFAAAMGITRIGNITGLDRIGIPVAVAVRPNSRSVSVAQGKGLDLEQAKASALMEACESFHAEAVGPIRSATYRQIAASGAVADPETLPATGRPLDPNTPIDWIEGYDLLGETACWLPAELVHSDYTLEPDGYFAAGSNGLASGNHLVEAVIAGICEVIERDAVALWHAAGLAAQAGRRLDLTSVDGPASRALLGLYGAAGVAVRVWDAASDIGVPVFLCQIRDAAPGEADRLRRWHGAGCHPDRAIALSRALTEAAQVRLTYIAGIRDDLAPSEYADSPAAMIGDALADALAAASPAVPFGNVAHHAADDLAEDLRWLLARLRAVGVERVVACDLTRPEFGIPVVRVVIPGLEGDPRHPSYVPGRRARAVR